MKLCAAAILSMSILSVTSTRSVALGPAANGGADIWLAGVDPFVRRAMDPNSPSDYMALFTETAPWSNAAGQIKVFKTSTQWLEQGTDADLRQMFQDLKRRGIALAVEGLMIPHPTPDSPGTGVEGFSDNPSGMLAAAQRVHELGGKLDYIAMDEPLWFGHHYAGTNAPHWSIATLVQELKGNVQAVRAIFPQVAIGDIEPIATNVPGWSDQIVQFANAFAQMTGRPFAFFHADIGWNNETGFLSPLQDITGKMRGLGIKIGYIYDGSGDAPTDKYWTDLATTRFSALEMQAANTPDHAVLQTWMLRPTHMLPETENGTMTALINAYARTAVALSLTPGTAGAAVTGRLAAVLSGEGVSGVPVTITALDNGPPTRKMITHMVTGTVPANAVAAVPVLRMNTECACDGPADVTVGPMTFRQKNNTATARFSARRYTVTPTQSVSVNAKPFRISAGATFLVSVPMRATYAAQGSGYVGVVFQDNNGAEIARIKIPFTPGTIWTRTAITDAGGSFVLARPYPQPDAVYEAHFSGDSSHRPTSFLPQD
jgi:hypothetical protein